MNNQFLEYIFEEKGIELLEVPELVELPLVKKLQALPEFINAMADFLEQYKIKLHDIFYGEK